MKKIIAMLLAVMLAVTGLFVIPASAATVVAEGIDVSYWQGPNINWNAVASHNHGDFAILRAYCYGKDSYFDTNYARAKQAGVPVGAYCYIYGTTTAAVQAEINALLSVIQGKQFEYPIYIDIEDTATYASLGRQAVTNLVNTACQMLENAGYFAGVYTYTNFANNYIYMNQLTNYTTWIAEYNYTCNYTGTYAMWQYGCEGSVGGISPVDVNYCYTDFPTIMKNVGLNGFPKNSNNNDNNNDNNDGEKKILAKGIDVSKWQMPVDWKKVAADPNVDYAIIRVTWSGLETTEWSTFYPEAKAAGVPIGCYAYTMASTVAEAKEEAKKTVELLKGKKFEYPIYIDAEEPSVYDGMDKATLTAIVKAECDVLRDAGYMAGVYANTNYATNKIDMSQLSQYAVWIADYRGYNGYAGEYGMWQYTDSGSVNGISGGVDMNYCYVDYPTYIKQQGLNGYEKEQPPVVIDPKVEAFRQIKDQLPVVDLLELTHANKVAELELAYNAIAEANKSQLTADEVSYMNAAVEKINHLEYLANLGDVTEDGSIDAKDALEVLKFAVGKNMLTQKQQLAAEVVGDHAINAKDALEILKFAVGKIVKFPIEG